MSGELEINIVAVERMKEYAITPTEVSRRTEVLILYRKRWFKIYKSMFKYSLNNWNFDLNQWWDPVLASNQRLNHDVACFQ